MSRLTKDQKAQKLLTEEKYEKIQQYMKEYPGSLMRALKRVSKIEHGSNHE